MLHVVYWIEVSPPKKNKNKNKKQKKTKKQIEQDLVQFSDAFYG